VIPDFVNIFTSDGYRVLPEGIWEVTIEEIEKKLLFSPRRIELFEKLKKALSDLKTIGCKCVFIDGSFVTDKILDNKSDIDVCFDETDIDWSNLQIFHPIFLEEGKRQKYVYECEFYAAYSKELNYNILFIDFFQQIKSTKLKKGILKLKL